MDKLFSSRQFRAAVSEALSRPVSTSQLGKLKKCSNVVASRVFGKWTYSQSDLSKIIDHASQSAVEQNG